jgi:YidC/Oxa1 family membrane protein insertase
MDRRTLLAFVLIFIVIFAFQEYSRRETMKRRAAVQAEAAVADPAAPDRSAADAAMGEVDAGATAIDDVASPPVAEPEVPADPGLGTVDSVLRPVNAGPEQQVVVTTPLYSITLAGRGARVVSWRGLAFDDHEGGLVELVPHDEAAVPYGMDAVSFNAAELELGRLLFETDAAPGIDVNSGTRSVTFASRTAGDLEIRKTYTFDAESYEIMLELELAAAGPQAATARSLLGLPRSVRFGWNQGIASTEGNDRFETAAFRSFAKVGEELEIKKRGGQLKEVDKVTLTMSGPFRFVGIQNKYFTIVGLPAQDLADAPSATIVLSGDETRNVQTWAVEMPLRTDNAGSDAWASRRLSLYIGPQEADRLKAYGIGLEKTMDLGWALFRPLTEATLWIMDQMRRFIPNYGVIIILFSILTKVAFYPLTRTSTQSMKKMQLLQPKVKAIQEKYKDNQEKQSKAMMELYKKEKVNPMAGCLPLLLQMPVFVALYQALAHTIALRNTPFVLWIDDLSQPDALFSLPFTLPFLGSDFNLLPLLMTATMVVQTRMTPTGQVQGQMAMMNTLMPVMMFFFFYQMPSGLVLYWLVNNVVTIYQTWRIHKTTVPEASTETS